MKLDWLTVDSHWDVIFDMYHPCEFYFDFIGHLETLNEDVDYLFQFLNITDVVHFDRAKRPTNSSKTVMLQEYFGQLSHELFQKVVLKYQDDFRVFGYKIPHNVSDIAL